MKATGMVRRIDELGRVVIPKEIRRTLRIKEGDPLEIFTDREELLLKKYSPLATLESFSKSVVESLNEACGRLAAVCDTDTVICAQGGGKKEIVGGMITEALADALSARKTFIANKSEGAGVIAPVKGLNYSAQIIVPVIVNGDCIGGVLILESAEGAKLGGTEIKLAQLAASFVAKQFI